ncbi:RNA polymerase sigma factor for flagellar operon FliA [Nocardioides zeae]|uniref:RNA polymerase sigma factor for flagellar operon FliA n=2 Tax=Nocardioides zeae TaxID=1457234 RepID=A0AAJ1UAK0_9ACTN|nr:sigma-70 family RNA polymerase sigma factor [Nocardioides zeae]MDQ1106602.1 RNA polymerase sigma factor for flagellar operon FliA [Nocardioides zeae]MDR6173719.1 RNA polymerase sigma factor for flagellar operon FliA [Nocardioides zeae]MDR6211122.1 RNA polymerase sigma factor for flagellar operon FliA [Nocardioides zeae]
MAPIPLPQQDELITSHVALVGHIVRETMNRVPAHVSRDDLTSAGLTALVQAAQSFDEERGVPFTRYAARRVRGAILDELRSVDWASRSVRRRARDLEETRSRLAATLGRPASADEIASAAGLSVAEIESNDDDIARAQVLSLQGAAGATLEETLVSGTATPEEALEHTEQLQYLVAAVAELPHRQRVVVEGYFFAERPMAEIAVELGVSESRISQIRAEALVQLRDAMNHALAPELVQPAARPGGCAARRRDQYVAAVMARHESTTGRGDDRRVLAFPPVASAPRRAVAASAGLAG